MADLFADNYYDYFAEKCHKAGLKFATEPYGNGGFDAMRAGAKSDVPLGEFWVNQDWNHMTKVASSMGHTHGQNIIGSEAFTASPDNSKWQNHPGSLKGLGDFIWTNGVNRFNFHSYAHQPWTDKLPGMTMGQWGTHFGRTNTWWEQSPNWMRYIARSQSLLQQGRFVADMLYFAGETPSNGYVTAGKPLRAAGFDHDLAGAALLAHARVENGNIVLPSGMRYRVLLLHDSQLLTPAVAAKVRDLVRDGATVIGNRPDSSPSLENYPECDAQVKAIGAQVWGDSNENKGQNQFGKGQVFWGYEPAEVLAKLSATPDFTTNEAAGQMIYIHRTMDDADVYFVSHQGDDAKMVDCFFRVTGRQPEIWNPLTGEISDAGLWKAQLNGTRVTLPMEPKGSLFVVFRKPAKVGAPTFTAATNSTAPASTWLSKMNATKNGAQMLAWENGRYSLTTSAGALRVVDVKNVPQPLILNNPWTVNFTPGWGAPDQIQMPQLQDWTQNADAGVRHYSGTATYRTKLNVPANFLAKTKHVELDLGRVEVLAQVIVNGRDLGVVWTKPYRVDISKAVKTGDNSVEIRVTNLWANRLIGDEEYPSDVKWDGWVSKSFNNWPDWIKENKLRPSTQRRTFTTWKSFEKGDALLPSGLLGPVQVRAAQSVELKANSLVK